MVTRVFWDGAEPDEQRRWKMVYWERLSAEVRPGICAATSPGTRAIPCPTRPAA